ncbi:MAG TPA: serine protease [Bacteroidia bacterium]|jgi:hypothetical protein|nr:serine protease [Bacteroidia bacterium]
MKLRILLLAFCIYSLNITAQNKSNSPFEFSDEFKLPQILLCQPVLLTIDSSETGSGVFISDSLNVYLVTARHCLYNIDRYGAHFKPHMLTILHYPHDIVSGNSALITIDFTAMKDSLVRYDKSHDIAIIKIGYIKIIDSIHGSVIYFPHILKEKSALVNAWPIRLTRKYQQINIGSDIYLFGYPRSIGIAKKPQFDYDRPLLRKGIIAGKYDRQKTLVLDSPVYFGNSGGPVFELIEYDGFQKGIVLIGIVSEYIPYQNEMSSQTSYTVQNLNSGYSIIEPIEFAINLINNYDK